MTVYRSADPDADVDARLAQEQLVAAGLDAIMVDDEEPGVMEGAYEVRVPPGEVARAEEILAARRDSEDEAMEVDASHDLDLEPIFESQALDAEVEAQAIRGILEANGIPAFVIGAPQIPSFPFEVKVPRARLEEARQMLEEARATGAADADQAEQEGESGVSEEPV